MLLLRTSTSRRAATSAQYALSTAATTSCTCCWSCALLFCRSSAVILSAVRAESTSRFRSSGCRTCTPSDVMYAGTNSVKRLSVTSRLTPAVAVAVAPDLNRRLMDTDEEKSVFEGATSPGGAPENSVVLGSRW